MSQSRQSLAVPMVGLCSFAVPPAIAADGGDDPAGDATVSYLCLADDVTIPQLCLA
jgi:hypothetical protein